MQSPLDPVKLLAALGDTVRYAIIRELAAGTPLNVVMLAQRVRRHPDLVSKHMRVLRESGAVLRVMPPDSDKREHFYQLPAAGQDSDGTHWADWKVAMLRFPPPPTPAVQ